MSDAHPEDPRRPDRATDARSHRQPRDPREGDRSPGYRPGPEDAAEADQGIGGDEILKTERGGGADRRAADEPAPTGGQEPSAEAGGGEAIPVSVLGPAVPGTTDEEYRGWLPTDEFLTPGEVLAAAFVAEVLWAAATAVLALAEKLAELPEPVAGDEFVSALLFGLVCGLYVLVRLRSRRLAWRRHLRGER